MTATIHYLTATPTIAARNVGTPVLTYRAVRGSINSRAAAIGATDSNRRRVLAVAFGRLSDGCSAAWAITQANRQLRDAPVARHHVPGGAA